MQDEEIDDDLFYKIDKKPVNEEPVYYYSRENRLARASQRVRDHNENQGKTKFTKAIAGHRSNLIILMCILVIFLMYFIVSRITAPTVSEIILGNNTLTVSVNQQESQLFLSVRKTVIPDTVPYTGLVDIVISPIQSGDSETQIHSQRIFFSISPTEHYLIALPFDASRFLVLFNTEYETLGTRVNK